MPITSLDDVKKNIDANTEQQAQPTQPLQYGNDYVEDFVVRDLAGIDPNYVPPVEAFNPYQDTAPQGVVDAQAQYDTVNITTQEYADDWQKRIIADHNGYITDDNYQGSLNRTLTDQAYNYIKRANNGADESAWERPNKDDELFTKYLPEIVKTEETRRQASEQMKKELPTDEQRMVQNVYNRSTKEQQAVIDAGSMEHGSWYLMSPLEKAKYLIVPGSNSTTMDNMPEWTKFITNIAPAAMAAGGGAMLGSLIPIPGAGAVVGGVVGGLTYLQGVTGVQIPIINDVLSFIDLGEKVEPYFTGGLSAISKAYNQQYGDASLWDTIKSGDLDIVNLATTTADILRDPNNKYLWQVSKYGYEVGADAMDDIIRTVRNAGAAVSDRVFGTEFGQRTADQVSRANIGRSGLESLAEGTYGANSLLDTYLPLFTDFVNEAMSNGMTEKEAIQFAHNNFQEYIINYTGTTGLVNDLAAQSVVDPANIAPFLQGKAAEGIGKITGDTVLQNAGKAAAGNPLIDILPPGIQQGAEGVLSLFQKNPNAPDILKTYGSQGMDIIKSTIKEGYRGVYDVDTLSGWQRYVAGIDKDGRIKEFMPNKQSGNAVKDWLTNLFKTTNDTKMFDVSMQTADFMGSALFNPDVPLAYVPDLVEQMVGRQPITPDSPLAPFQNTAMLKTLQDQFAGVGDEMINKIKADVQTYRQYDLNRTMVNQVAKELGMTPEEIFDALDNKNLNAKDPKYRMMTEDAKKAALDSDRQKLYQEIREKGITYQDGNGKTYSPDEVIQKIEVFKKNTESEHNDNWVGRKQYSDSFLKASIMTELADTADNFNLIRYNIAPDAWAVRTTNLMKSVQSIALLNFSTSYQVNNFLNNMLTRSVVGVGGFDPKFVNDVNKARGLSLTKDSSTYDQTSRRIRDAKKPNDKLQKVTDLYDDVSKTKLLKGVNNIDVEGIETNAAANIGFNRYWNATWANNIPEIPKAWEALGITKDMKEQVFKVALDSPNAEAFRQNIMGEIVLPKAQSTLNQMLANYMDGNTSIVLRDFFATKPWIQDMVDAFLETGDERLITRGFDDLINKLTSDVGLQNAVQYESTFEDLRNTYADQGIGAVATSFEALVDLYSQFWIKQTKENGTLFLDRVVGAIKQDDFDNIYKARMQIQTNDYNIVRGYAIMNIGAMTEGLGIDSQVATGLMSNIMQFIDLGETYIKQENQLYQKYAKADSANYDMSKYMSEKATMLETTLNTQLDALRNFNKTLVDYLRTNLDNNWTGDIDDLAKLLDDAIKLKKAENKTEIQEWRKRVNTNYKGPRARVSLEQENPRVARKQQIHDAYVQAAQQLKKLETAMPAKPTPAGPMTLDNTLRLQMIYEEAKHKSDFAGEFLKKYKDEDNPAKVFEPLNFENKTIKTSVYEWAQQEIINDAIKNGTDAAADAASYQERFSGGDTVPLGMADAVHAKNIGDAVYIPAQHKLERLVLTDHYELLNPKAKVKEYNYAVARSKPFAYGDSIVNAGVYHKGNLIGYITAGMQETVVVDGKTFPILGVSADDPNTMLVLVKDKVRKVTPGKLDNIEYSIYAKENFHPGDIGKTPTIEPWGQAAWESSFVIRQAVDLWKQQAISDLRKAQENGSFFGKLTPEQRVALFEWMDGDLRQAYNAQRYMTQRYGETMVDAALLNYNKRYGFDNMLTMICPYQFWMTRSLANWGKRMISQPAWFSMYARLQRLIEKNKKDFLPTRLNGLVGIPMPNMGDGMGDSLFFDIMNVVFPFQQFYNATDYFMKNVNTIHQNTLTRIDKMYQDGELFNGQPITEEMYNEAMEYGRGDLYKAVFEEERRNDESDTSSTALLSTFLAPPTWFDIAYKHIRGKDKDISYSPMFRMGNMIKAAGDETPLEDLTNFIGGTLQLPENGLRRTLGIESNPDGNYADYGIISNIANMRTEMKISENEALNAIAEGPGNKIYDEALRQYRQQQAIRMQGGALAVEAGQSLGGNKDTSLGQIAGSALASLFGAKTYSEGERMHREQQQIYRDMISKLDKNSEAYKQFWKDYPEYSIHNYSYEDSPEKRYHKVLVDNLSNAYYALPQEQRNLVYRQLGGRFQKLFADKETRATDYLDNDEIIQWTRAMQGNVPNIDGDSIDKSMQNATNLLWYSDSVLGKKERYEAEKARKFPGIDVVQNGYYNTAPERQNQYLADNPMLSDYWDWNNKIKRANPELATLMNNDSASGQVYFGKYDNITSAIMGKVNKWTRDQLKDYIDYGFAMKPDADRNLKIAYQGLMINTPYEEWLRSIVK